MEIKNRQNKLITPEERSAASEKQLRGVAELYEKQFLREMVKQMRTTVGESTLMPASFAEKYYREQLDEQYVESWGDRGGIGLGKLIYDQLIFRYGEMMGIKVPQGKPSGPLPMSQKDQWGTRIEAKDKSIVFTKKEVISEAASKELKDSNLEMKTLEPTNIADRLGFDESVNTKNSSFNLESPWTGRWLGSFELENGLKVAKIQHDGFQSVLVGNFQTSHLKVGDVLTEGEKIGVLAPDAKQLNWKLIKTENRSY